MSGSSNGYGTYATFRGTTGLTIDTHGDFFVAEYYGFTIRKITRFDIGCFYHLSYKVELIHSFPSSNGFVSTYAGNGTMGSSNGFGTYATFNYPWGVAADVNGNVFVGDRSNNMIRKIDRWVNLL